MKQLAAVNPAEALYDASPSHGPGVVVAWIGGQLPADLHQVWRWYLGRFTVEHTLRFTKERLGWTAPAFARRSRWTAGPG